MSKQVRLQSITRRAITLIEVMIVIIIIAALASMVAPYLMDVPDKMKAKIVEADMQRLDTSLKLFRLENGTYPIALGVLMKVPDAVKGRKEAYLEREPKDPWGQWYQYKFPGTKSIVGYDLYSMGANQRDDGGDNDDISNWKSAKKE